MMLITSLARPHRNNRGLRQDVAALQVELNTIASSFGCLSTQVCKLHRYIVERAGQPELVLSNLPENDVTSHLADAIGTAVAEFGDPGAAVLFIVQPNERNSYDQQVFTLLRMLLVVDTPQSAQAIHCTSYSLYLTRGSCAGSLLDKCICLGYRRHDVAVNLDLVRQLLRRNQWHNALPVLQWLQYAMWERHKVCAVRRTLAQVAQQGSLDARRALSVAGQRIAVCYYRAGYAPTDYPSEQEWGARSGPPA